MKNIPALLLLSCFAILNFSGCGKDEKSLCGVELTWDTYISPSDLIYNDFDFLNGTRRLFYENLAEPEDICAHEHVTARFRVQLHHDSIPIPDSQVKGVAYWGLYEDDVLLGYDANTNIYEGEMEVGLKQAFGDSPAWIGLQILLVIPSVGTLEEDTFRINGYVQSAQIQLQYHKFAL